MLEGLRVVEGSAFVAAPSGAMTLAQLGADVIRFDQIGGGLDYRRWPLTEAGESLYWAGLNKGKRSVAVNLRDRRAQELLTQLVADSGTFITNFPARGWLDPERLRAQRADLVMMAITGNRDGTTALDYTVNCAVGYPASTGPIDGDEPINHVLPAWDLICGQTAAVGILAADRRRLLTGQGAVMGLALCDVAMAAVAALGNIGEYQINGTQRARYGNDVYGAFGSDFDTADDRRIYVVAISAKQWSVLQAATDTTEAVAGIERDLGLDFSDEGDRFAARAQIKAVMAPWIEARPLAEVARAFDDMGVCWGPYQDVAQMVDDDPRCSVDSGLFRMVDQPGIGSYLTPGSPLTLDAGLPTEPSPAPDLGQHTEEVLADVLKLSRAEIAVLFDEGVVGQP